MNRMFAVRCRYPLRRTAWLNRVVVAVTMVDMVLVVHLRARACVCVCEGVWDSHIYGSFKWHWKIELPFTHLILYIIVNLLPEYDSLSKWAHQAFRFLQIWTSFAFPSECHRFNKHKRLRHIQTIEESGNRMRTKSKSISKSFYFASAMYEKIFMRNNAVFLSEQQP